MAYSESAYRGDMPPATTARTFVAVLDGGRAAVFHNDGFDAAPALRSVVTLENDNKKARELGRDKPGRFATPNAGRTTAAFTDHHDKRELEFVDGVLSRLEDLARRDQFDRLVLLASAQWIRRFRERAPTARAKLVAIRIGDFAHARVERIEEAFREAMRPTPSSSVRERA
jgi:protein required for attachment to host cells